MDLNIYYNNKVLSALRENKFIFLGAFIMVFLEVE